MKIIIRIIVLVACVALMLHTLVACVALMLHTVLMSLGLITSYQYDIFQPDRTIFENTIFILSEVQAIFCLICCISIIIWLCIPYNHSYKLLFSFYCFSIILIGVEIFWYLFSKNELSYSEQAFVIPWEFAFFTCINVIKIVLLHWLEYVISKRR